MKRLKRWARHLIPLLPFIFLVCAVLVAVYHIQTYR